MKRLIVSLILITLLSGCGKTSVCPEFPTPSPEAAQAMHRLSQENDAVKEWGNQLLKLQEKLDQ